MTVSNRSIRSIQVKRLFGTYDYSLKASEHACDSERLMILYGENGSGKTTILRTLFHLLAPERREGHKTAIGKTPFARFEVNFNSGDHVWAERPGSKITGSFTMGLRLARKKETIVEFTIDAEKGVLPTPKQDAFLGRLRELNIGLYFLTDDRTVQLAGKEGRETFFTRTQLPEKEAVSYSDFSPQFATYVSRIDAQFFEKPVQQLLPESIKRAEMWIQSQAVKGASEGELSVNTLYGEILKRISALPLETNPPLSDTIQEIEGRVVPLETRSKQYAKYGLLPEFNGREILDIIKSAPPSHLSIITKVIIPYIESVEKKLDAMEHLQTQVDSLVSIINSFFTRKKINFEIHQGFSIVTDDGKELLPQMLSSGERHLLLLFCNTLIAHNRPSIFMIDEPEISLNVKWQRRLLSSLLECVGKNPVQYLFATHSFEILAQYKDNAVKLGEESEGLDGRETNS